MKSLLSETGRILEEIRTHARFVLTTHIHPDGDGIGSELALSYFLSDLDKEVRIINPSPMPAMYGFLDPDRTRVHVHDNHHAGFIRDADVLIVFDASATDRLGTLARDVQRSRCLRICIDHHATRDSSCDVAWIDERASATGELVFSLLKQAKHRISPEIAKALYVAIMTDTGCFRHANVTANTHRVVAQLLQTGIDHHGIFRRVYESDSWDKSMLFARTIGDLQRACDGKVAWMKITQQMFKETGTEEKDIEGLAEFPRSIEDVQMAILFIEQTVDCIRVRFRSRHDIAVDALARQLGGGGHRNASAAVLEGTNLEGAIDRVLRLVSQYLRP